MTVGRKITQNKQTWNTPKKYADLIHLFFENNLDLDPCSNGDSIIDARKKIILPQDGLKIDWNFSTIYINPPYGRDYERKTTIKHWIEKAYASNSMFDSEILMLIPVSTNTSHWKNFIFGKAKICFLKETRLVFRINGLEENKGSPMACAMIYYGSNFNKFKNAFMSFGYCVE